MPETTVPPVMTWSVPARDSAAVAITAHAGRVTTIVGANGAGKSALATWLVAQMPSGTVRRLIAHRKIWFSSSGPEINPAQRERHGQNAEQWDRRSDSRYADHLDGNRANIALFDLLGMINDQNRKAVEMYDGGRTRDEVLSEAGERLLPKLNRILANAGLHISIALTASQTFMARHSDLGVEFPIFHMSDGEKSALLLAAEVLTAPVGQVIVIDEPERHLHRSISAGLVDAIVAERSDAAFVLLTHDLELASALGAHGTVVTLTGCEWSGETVATWEVNLVADGGVVSELARQAILGGRKQVMFIEGDVGSLDLPLYRVLYPDWTCAPAGGCDSVIKSVAGIRASSQFHWVRAVGIVDGDGRSEAERAALRSRSVLALPVNEVESLYYLSSVLEAVAGAQAAVIDASATSLMDAAKSALLQSLSQPETVDRFARKLALAEVRRKVVDHIPEVLGEKDIQISVPSPFNEIRDKLESILASGDYEGMVKEVSIRDSSARAAVARAMGFGSFALYERAARRQITENSELRVAVREAVGALPG
ncbi:AAA family ATPase [Agromyces cerinus]|nr:AAA family ATPase [Agromyces cerinus]